MVRPGPDGMHVTLHRTAVRPTLTRAEQRLWWLRRGMPGTRRMTCWAGALAAVMLSSCGDAGPYANRARPPAPINVTAAITEDAIAVSPQRFGAGPIVLLVSNQTDAAHSVTFETDEIAGRGPGLRQTTSPINPASTAELQLDVRQGTYRLSTDSGRAGAASIRVGRPRPSAQDELLLP